MVELWQEFVLENSFGLKVFVHEKPEERGSFRYQAKVKQLMGSCFEKAYFGETAERAALIALDAAIGSAIDLFVAQATVDSSQRELERITQKLRCAPRAA